MNRKQRRNIAKRINTPQKLEEAVAVTVQQREKDWEKYYKRKEQDFIDVMIYMTAYTLNYKLGLGKQRLPKIMHHILDNIEAFATGHLKPEDFDTIKAEMIKLGVKTDNK